MQGFPADNEKHGCKKCAVDGCKNNAVTECFYYYLCCGTGGCGKAICEQHQGGKDCIYNECCCVSDRKVTPCTECQCKARAIYWTCCAWRCTCCCSWWWICIILGLGVILPILILVVFAATLFGAANDAADKASKATSIAFGAMSSAFGGVSSGTSKTFGFGTF